MDGRTLVQKIDTVLKEKGCKRQALAEYCGISTQVFSDWIRRGNLPVVNVALKMADFLGVSLNWLFEDDYDKQWKDYENLSDSTAPNISPRELMYRVDIIIRQQQSNFAHIEDEGFYTGILDIFSFDQLNAMKDNRYQPSMVQLYEVSKRLNLPLDWLITGSRNDKISEPNLQINSIAIRYPDFLKTYHSLSDAYRKIIDSDALCMLENMNKIRMAIRDGTPLDDIPELN